MPRRTPTICGKSGCSGLWTGERCTKCNRTPKSSGWQSDKERGTRQERGYGNDWLKLRAAKLRADPLCERCLAMKPERVTEAVQVHHIKPFHGLDDPLRLDWDNLLSVCVDCHKKLRGGGR